MGSDKERVLSVYPHAEYVLCFGEYWIRKTPRDMASIGSGPTEERAWAHAASRLNSKQRKE